MEMKIIKEKIFNLVGNEYTIIDTRENVNTHEKIKLKHWLSVNNHCLI